MPTLLDLTWKPSKAAPELPVDVYPHLAPAIYRGDDYTIHVVLLDGDDPWEPEGTLHAQVRKERLKAGATVGDPIAEFDVTVDVNEVTLELDGDQTATVPDSCYWDLQETLDDGTRRTWFTGKAKAWGDITREEEGS